MSQTHEQLIRYAKSGKFTDFMRDVCKLSKTRLLQFAAILKVNVLSSASYDQICSAITTQRPDLLKSVNTNTWKKWGSWLAGVVVMIGSSAWADKKNEQVIDSWRKGQADNYYKSEGYTTGTFQERKQNWTKDNNMKFIEFWSSSLIILIGGVSYYRRKEEQIAVAIQYLRDNPDLHRISKQISRSYSRSHSKTTRRRRSRS